MTISSQAKAQLSSEAPFDISSDEGTAHFSECAIEYRGKVEVGS
jgi:hypothetical protein